MSEISGLTPDVLLAALPSVFFFAIVAFPILIFMKRNLIVRLVVAFVFALWVAWILTALIPHFSMRLVDLVIVGTGVCLAFLAVVIVER